MVFNSRKSTKDAKQCPSCGADMNETGRGCSWEKCKLYEAKMEIKRANTTLKEAVSCLRSLDFEDRNIIQRVLTTLSELDNETEEEETDLNEVRKDAKGWKSKVIGDTRFFWNNELHTQMIQTYDRDGALSIEFEGKTYTGCWSSRGEVIRKHCDESYTEQGEKKDKNGKVWHLNTFRRNNVYYSTCGDDEIPTEDIHFMASCENCGRKENACVCPIRCADEEEEEEETQKANKYDESRSFADNMAKRIEADEEEEERISKLEERKAKNDEFDKSRPNNVSIMKRYGLDTMWKVELCTECKRKELIQFEPANPDMIAHWECNECGSEFEDANKCSCGNEIRYHPDTQCLECADKALEAK